MAYNAKTDVRLSLFFSSVTSFYFHLGESILLLALIYLLRQILYCLPQLWSVHKWILWTVYHLGVNCIYFLFSAQTFQSLFWKTLSSMSIAILWGWFIMTMSGICVVTQMSVGTVEIPHLLLWPGRSEWMIQSVSLLRFCARMYIWLRTLLCLQVYLPSFNIVGQLLRVCSSVSWCAQLTFRVGSFFTISWDYCLLVGYQELSSVNIWQCFLVSWTCRTSMLYLKVQTLQAWKNYLDIIKFWYETSMCHLFPLWSA